jgi:two-component system cell cycle sensor histidine kinase/response regulator CckA
MDKSRILLVEDEPSVRSYCGAVLRNAGFDPIFATDGLDGLRIYRERHEEIGLILSDVMMPNMSGIDMVQDVLSMHSDAKVVLMSGYGLPDKIPSQVCSVLSKPFVPRQLVAAVKKCLDPIAA